VKSLGDGNLNLPFEKFPELVPAEELNMDDAAIACGMVVLGAVAGVGDEPTPALAFRFVRPDGQFYPPMLLVISVDEARLIGTVVGDAATAAIEAAGKPGEQ
jgi:hypothetical protein